MPDPAVVDVVLKGATDAIAAIAALGTAASGLVDATKISGIQFLNVSYYGSGTILDALRPFESALKNVLGDKWEEAILSPWINGAPQDAQKNTSKSIIRLGLTAANAPKIADAAHVDAAALGTAIGKLEKGLDLDPSDINVLGRLDATIDTILNAAYERADQTYRNTAKFTAGIFAVALALAGDYILSKAGMQHDWLLAVLVGIVSVPLAPIAKDLTTALQTAVKSLGSVTSKAG